MFQRTEVLTIMAHLLITLAVILSYGYTVAIGKPDTTLQNLLLLCGGFWFGAMGITRANKPNQPNEPNQPNQPNQPNDPNSGIK